MINNPKAARIVAAVVIAMLVITLAASLFGCSAAKPASASTKDPDSGLAYVAVADLPKEAQQTLRLIDQGRPFPYSRDGVVFGNFEKILPKQNRGYYHEYTVKTPGESDRGTRRIVTGKNSERYFTDDHYKSFRRIQADEGSNG